MHSVPSTRTIRILAIAGALLGGASCGDTGPDTGSTSVGTDESAGGATGTATDGETVGTTGGTSGSGGAPDKGTARAPQADEGPARSGCRDGGECADGGSSAALPRGALQAPSRPSR